MPEPPPRPWSQSALFQLVLVRHREFLREPEAVFWVFIFPILLATGLGIAFRNRPPERTHVAVLAGAPQSADLATALRADSSITVKVTDDAAAAKALRTGQVALLVVPEGDRVGFRYDDTRPDGRLARLLVENALERQAGRQDPVAISNTLVREPGSRYIDFVVPGLLGMNLMGSGIWGVGFALVDARRKKLLKRLIATPMSRAQYLGSFLISRLVMLVVEVVLLLGFARLAFGVPFRGSLLGLGLIALCSALSFSGIGLLIASRPTTIEGASGLMNLAMMPMWVFSGVFFSSSNFPAAMQPYIKALPLTAVNDALRANMIEGAGLVSVLPQLAVILAWLMVSFTVALKVFRWK